MISVFRQQWKDEKNELVKQITDLEKTLKGKEEKSRKLEKEYKKVWLIYNQMDRYVSCDPPPS